MDGKIGQLLLDNTATWLYPSLFFFLLTKDLEMNEYLENEGKGQYPLLLYKDVFVDIFVCMRVWVSENEKSDKSDERGEGKKGCIELQLNWGIGTIYCCITGIGKFTISILCWSFFQFILLSYFFFILILKKWIKKLSTWRFEEGNSNVTMLRCNYKVGFLMLLFKRSVLYI